MVKTMYISDMREGMKLECDVFLLIEKSTGITRRGQPYLALTVSDRTGRIPVRFWNVPKGIPESLKVGEGVLIKGTVTSWRGTLQLTAKAVAPCSAEPLEELITEDSCLVEW